MYGDWTAVSGSFSMSTDSDQLFVYVGNEADPVFVFGLSTGPWVTDGTDIGTTNSVCPESLTEGGVNGSIAFSIVDNGAYYGPQLGTKNELLASICNSQNWLTSDSRYFYPNSTEFIVIDSTDAPTEQPASGSGASNKAVDVYGSLGKSGFVGLIVAIIVLFIMAAAFGVRQYLWKGKGLLSAMEN